MPVPDQRHPQVRHPRAGLNPPRTGPDRYADAVLDFMTDHMLGSRVFFMIALIVPLIVLPMSTSVKVTLGVISGSWIQWWALHALQRRASAADASRDAKADADHAALSHIALTADAILAALPPGGKDASP